MPAPSSISAKSSSCRMWSDRCAMACLKKAAVTKSSSIFTSCLATSIALSRHSSKQVLAYCRMARSNAGNCEVRLSSMRPSSVYFPAILEAALAASPSRRCTRCTAVMMGSAISIIDSSIMRRKPASGDTRCLWKPSASRHTTFTFSSWKRVSSGSCATIPVRPSWLLNTLRMRLVTSGSSSALVYALSKFLHWWKMSLMPFGAFPKVRSSFSTSARFVFRPLITSPIMMGSSSTMSGACGAAGAAAGADILLVS
mmetsp:Transcript_12060/g.36196  ORF Transcript_12060/g.36196 Transcript_12060/m.36196 type:complete len:255 (-) Transcript_12060:164-928(-)